MSAPKVPSLGSVLLLNVVVAALLATRARARWNILIYGMLGNGHSSIRCMSWRDVLGDVSGLTDTLPRPLALLPQITTWNARNCRCECLLDRPACLPRVPTNFV